MFDYFESQYDIIGHLRPLFARGVAYVRDGKVHIKGNDSWDVPWIYITPDGEAEEHTRKAVCFMCQEIKFKYWHFIPVRCHNCWKVVVRPRTLKELFDLHELQKELNLWSKAGIEDRPRTPHIYGGYFYNKTLKEARKCRAMVQEAVSSKINPDIPINIKRGCTEFEEKFQESKQWTIAPGVQEFEDYLDERIVLDIEKSPQPDFVILNVKRKWVERACEVGHDYLDFAGGRSISTLVTTY